MNSKDLEKYFTPNNSVDGSPTKRFLPYQVHLPKSILHLNLFNKGLQNSPRYGDSSLLIESVESNKLKFYQAGWKDIDLEINFDPATEMLSAECSCQERSISKLRYSSCRHLYEAIEKLIDTFGVDFFTEDYLDNQKKLFLEQYGMSLSDDYSKIFDFELGVEGISVRSKFKNIHKDIGEDPLCISDIYRDKTAEAAANVPYAEKTNNEIGLGFCFVFASKKMRSFFAVKGKYNKLKTDFASSISLVDNFLNSKELFSLENDEEQKGIINALKINNLYINFQHENSIDDLRRIQHEFDKIKELIKSRNLYRYDSKKSLVRKHLLPISIGEDEPSLFFTITESEFLYTLKAKLAIGDKTLNLNSSKLQVNAAFIFFEDEVFPIKNVETGIFIEQFKEKAEQNFLKKDFPLFYRNVVLPLSQKFEVKTAIFKKNELFFEDKELEKHVYINDFEGESILFRLAVKYPTGLININSKELILCSQMEGDSEMQYTQRNQSFEDNFLEEFKSQHPLFKEQEAMFFLSPKELIADYWLIKASEQMESLGIRVFGANALKSFKFNVNKPSIRMGFKSDIDWFDLELEISFGDQKVGLKDLQKTFLQKNNYIELKDGTIGILPEEWMKKLSNYFKVGEIKKEGIKFSKYQFGVIDELLDEMEEKPAFLIEMMATKRRLQNISEIEEVEIPKGLKAKLRDYQKHGLNWLAFLDQHQLGGCLADDMGLGKTLQAIAFLQHLKLTKKPKSPSLIIAPTSLIFNWKNEIEKFCPSLKLLVFVGADRMAHKNNFAKYDLIISTYGSLLNDVELIKEIQLNYIILDESQSIKNPNSKRYKAVRLLKSYNRLALTGTPIENNTFDLFAQMNFLNPGLLGNMAHFKSVFSSAIDKQKDQDAAQLLSQTVSPFLLRRTKEQVAKELPAKTESIIYCEMPTEQRRVYESFKNKYRESLLNKIDENGVENAQMYILEGLMKLRQICNSTALLNDQEDYGNYSVKMDILLENIKEKTGKHKILVFSQFVKMLKIIKGKLDDENISYEYLDGQTNNRQDRVNNFQDNKDVRVFLISLKAGGVGLNLTEADYVFLVDPWWNPAVENQAIDRSHRIGQTQHVMAYRMICKDTIEEKIVSLQGKKKAVAASIIQVDEEKKTFDLQTVKDLFS